jgi:hypothetical protein
MGLEAALRVVRVEVFADGHAAHGRLPVTELRKATLGVQATEERGARPRERR